MLSEIDPDLPAATPPAMPPPTPLPAPDLACFALAVAECVAHGHSPDRVPAPGLPPQPIGGVFVTLKRLGQLRGCMGILQPIGTTADMIRHAAVCAATQDPRFRPLRPEELRELEVTVSLLSEPRPMQRLEELEIGRHGIIVQRGPQRGLFLPQVATDFHMSREYFLSRCCSEKAGLPPDAWRDPGTQVWLFTTVTFSAGPT